MTLAAGNCSCTNFIKRITKCSSFFSSIFSFSLEFRLFSFFMFYIFLDEMRTPTCNTEKSICSFTFQIFTTTTTTTKKTEEHKMIRFTVRFRWNWNAHEQQQQQQRNENENDCV